MQETKSNNTLTVNARVIKKDGTIHNLGTIAEIKNQKHDNLFDKVKNKLNKLRGV